MLDAGTVKLRVAAAAALDLGIVDAQIEGVQGLIERLTGRYFGEPASVTEYLIGNGTFELFLASKLDSGTPTVTERSRPGGTDTAVAGFAVRQGTKGTWLARTDGFVWKQWYEYEVTYSRGYTLGDAPPEIQQLGLDLIALRLNVEGQEGLKSGSVGAFSFTRASDSDLDALPGAWETIRAWRRPVMV